MLVGALTGYARQAYAACDPNPASPFFVCSGANAATQNILLIDNATVSTVAGFSVDAAAGNAISITGDGALSYTDTNASYLRAPGTALFIKSNGDAPGPVPGSVTVDSDGTLIAVDFGIDARNYGSGAVAVTANGDITATDFFGDGINAFNSVAGSDLTVTTGANSTVTAADAAIFANSRGSGALMITANGDLFGAGGIVAENYFGTGLSVTTGAGTTAKGTYNGIIALNFRGTMSIAAYGNVTGTNTVGIFALNYAGASTLTVTTGAGSKVTGGFFGGILPTTMAAGR